MSDTLVLPLAATAGSPTAAQAVPGGLGGISARHRVMVLLPAVVATAGAAGLWPFVSHALMSNPILNGLILSVLAWGVWTMIGHTRRVYHEDRVFRSGMAWLRKGAWGSEQDPRLGPQAFVSGMIERLQKLGLGHQVYIHSSAMEPEIEALEQYLEKRQELSQFLVGLMVGLGLLGTFIGLLETLVETSKLIGTIAKSAGGGGNMEQEFAKIVGGLQGPLAAMGTAFSASMFGLVGSILLGFQMVAVRKAVSDLVEDVRSEVLSLGEKSKVSEKVEITERFLATLLADLLEQHRAASAGLAGVMARLDALVPEVKSAATASAELALRVHAQEQVLERTAAAVGVVGDVLPEMAGLARSAHAVLQQAEVSNQRVGRMLAFLPTQEKLLDDVRAALSEVAQLSGQVNALGNTTQTMRDELRHQAALVKRMDATLWNAEKASLRDALGDNKI